MSCESTICERIKIIVSETENCIKLLYSSQCTYARNMLLNQITAKMNEIDYLNSLIYKQLIQMQVSPAELPQQNTQRDITLQELSKFNGKDGNPAYVAVNGTVYDVTNNAAWAAASHFGLTAGKDLTGEFASCHAGQSILSKLKVVGKLLAVES